MSKVKHEGSEQCGDVVEVDLPAHVGESLLHSLMCNDVYYHVINAY